MSKANVKRVSDRTHPAAPDWAKFDSRKSWEIGPLYMQCTLANLVEMMRESESLYRRLRGEGADPGLLSEHISKYLHLVETALWKARLIEDESLVIFEVQKMLDLGRKGKETSACPSRRTRQTSCFPRVAHVLRLKRRQLSSASTTIKEKSNWVCGAGRSVRHWRGEGSGDPRHPAVLQGPYGDDIIRKWHRLCDHGKHPESEHFNYLLMFYSQEWYDPEFALNRLRDLLGTQRW